MICEHCKKNHNGQYGSGRFCSSFCARSFSTSKNKDLSKRKRKNTWKKKEKKLKDINNIDSILDLSSRTVSKILKRSKIGCSICSWNKASLDIHHIKSRKNKGSNLHENLIAVCPNCHRMAHESLYSEEFLSLLSFDKILPKWKEFYNLKMGKTPGQ